MKAPVLSLHGAEHRVAQELLPWYVNETLEPGERARVDAHLAECGPCQADAAALGRLRGWAFADDAADRADAGWAALRVRLERPSGPAVKRSSPWQLAWRRWLPHVVGLQSAAIVLLVFLVWGGLSSEPAYHALGSAIAPAAADALVVFRPETTEPRIRQALVRAGARLVDGPTSTGAYLVVFAGGRADGIAVLKAQSGVGRVDSLAGDSR